MRVNTGRGNQIAHFDRQSETGVLEDVGLGRRPREVSVDVAHRPRGRHSPTARHEPFAQRKYVVIPHTRVILGRKRAREWHLAIQHQHRGFTLAAILKAVVQVLRREIRRQAAQVRARRTDPSA
jgi:hypothetical protein